LEIDSTIEKAIEVNVSIPKLSLPKRDMKIILKIKKNEKMKSLQVIASMKIKCKYLLN
jgi:hypothetical protein